MTDVLLIQRSDGSRPALLKAPARMSGGVALYPSSAHTGCRSDPDPSFMRKRTTQPSGCADVVRCIHDWNELTPSFVRLPASVLFSGRARAHLIGGT